VGNDPLGNIHLKLCICVAFYPEYVDDNSGRPVLKEGKEIIMNIAHIAWTRGKVRGYQLLQGSAAGADSTCFCRQGLDFSKSI
jgi:hypothetical protein